MKFVQARNYTRTAGRHVDVIVLHTMEYPERPTGAEWCADYFARTGAPRASAHYMVDNDTIVQGVRDVDVAWAAPGANHNGIQIEHAGYAAQGKKGWADAYSQSMLKLSGGLTAKLCRRHRVPVRWLTVADLKAGRRGITSHANVSAAFKRSDHTDPGHDFPVELYLRWVHAAMPAPAPKPEPRYDVDGPKGGPILRNVRWPVAKAKFEEYRRRFGGFTVRRRK